MATNRPNTGELVEAVLEFLSSELQPELKEPSLKFKLRVATNALHIVQRELQLAPSHGIQERSKIQAFLQSEEDDIAELNRTLCKKIRRGDYDGEAEPLMRMLTALTVNKLAIDNPGYSTYLALTSD